MNQPAPCSKWTWALVLAVAAGPYLNTLNGGFHYDDEHALVRNTHLRQLSAVPGFFVDSSTFSSEPDMAMYRPLLQTTFALNHALGGYDAWSWHLVNVLLHAFLDSPSKFVFVMHFVGQVQSSSNNIQNVSSKRSFTE